MELISAQYTHRLIDANEKSLLAVLIGDHFAHITFFGTAPLKGKKSTVSPTVDKNFYKWGASTAV
jgi:hypothetical protein